MNAISFILTRVLFCIVIFLLLNYKALAQNDSTQDNAWLDIGMTGITRDQLTRYFAGEISTRQMLTPLDDLSFIDTHYNNIDNGIKVNQADDILRNI